MICLIALVVFAILGIFSAYHRKLAIEAFDCVFRRMTLRKCNTGFDRKMKMKISTGLIKKSPAFGNFVFKHFELISWILTILMIASFLYSIYSVYNFAAYGSCDPSSPTTCIYNDIASAFDKNVQIVPDKNISQSFTSINGECPPNFTPLRRP